MQQDHSEPARRPCACFIEVSPEMTAILGADAAAAPIPSHAVAIIVTLCPEASALRIEVRPKAKALIAGANAARIVFLIRREAMARLGGGGLIARDADFHLTHELRALVLALRDPGVTAEARTTYQLAKSIEFVCETIRQFRAGELAPLSADGRLSAADTRRMFAARQMIQERAGEKLTLAIIARDCGLNRSKLTRGFKALFDCTVAEALAERRLDLARSMLLTTDLPVSSIGYETGYLNNASFSRAFGRRFGRSPSHFRMTALAA